MFRALITGKVPPPDDLQALARDAAGAARASRPRRTGRRLAWVVEEGAAGAAALRWRLVAAAVALLTSPLMERVSACPGCGWFFLDASKSRSRRWCSMATCGNTAKARAYHQRHRSA